MTTTSIKEVRELVNSLNAKSASLSKLLPVSICNSTILVLVYSGNSFYNAMSLAVATKIGLTYYQPYEGPPVGTALAGSTLDIVGVIRHVSFSLTYESGKRHLLSSRLVIVPCLSCGLNISLPFLVENGLDQLHSQGVLSWTEKQVQFPLYWNMTIHANSFHHLHQWTVSSPLENQRLKWATRTAKPYLPTQEILNATVSGKAIVKKQADTVFSYKNSFINKIHHLRLNKEHPSHDENHFGLNSLDQAALINESNDIGVYFFNETNTLITISSNNVIGSINPFTLVVTIW